MAVEKPELKAEMSFEAALAELEQIVSQLEAGDVSLDTAIDAYARGMELKAHCQKRLEEARLRVEKIRLPEDGSQPQTAEPFDPAGQS